MYRDLTGEDPLQTPMRIYPAAHYTMGGLWVDYDLQSTLPGLFVAGEANFSDHGANRLGASALMQGLADGTFILPLTIGGYLAAASLPAVDEQAPEVAEARGAVEARLRRLLGARGRRPSAEFHRELGALLRARCGLARDRAGLEAALAAIPSLREAFWREVAVPGGGAELNQELERAGRVADYLELAELMCRDALAREESCGSHFRQEHATDQGEPRRDDARFAHVAVWFHRDRQPPRLVHEPLAFSEYPPVTRSYR
jgi:succinate dehydrogenase / fumarate reductase flavoprotein subunit